LRGGDIALAVATAHWTNQLFLEHAEIFLRIHEHALDRAEPQARALKAMLERWDIKPPARILDAPCGIGRHDVHLAKFGYRVTGLDFAPLFLERARRLAVDTATDPEFVLGDLREPRAALTERDGTYSAILNLWTSFGYWGEDTDLEIFREFHALTTPGGVLVLDTVNRDWVVREFRPQGYEEWGDLVHIEERSLDYGTSWILGPWRFYTKHGEDLVHRATMSVDHRLYSAHEVKGLVESAGWRTAGVFGGLGMEPLTVERPRLVLVAQKEA